MKRPIKIVAHPNSSGSGTWRIKDPFYFLNKSGKFDCRWTTDQVTPEELNWADIILTQSLVDKNQIALIYEWQQEHGLKWIMEQDDLPKLTPDNPFKLDHDITDAAEVINISLGVCDLVTASTPYLAEELKKTNPNVVVLPNYMNMSRWDIKPKVHNESDRVRILWAGSITHMEDMKIIAEPLTLLSKEFKNLEFYCIGDIRMSKLFKDIDNVEFMLGTTNQAWPDKLRGVRADIGLAPLQDVSFTRCKSWIKPLEYGINEIPSVVSDVEPYKCFKDWDGVHVVKYGAQWYQEVRDLIVNKEQREAEGKALYKRIKNEMDIRKHIKLWEDAYLSLL